MSLTIKTKIWVENEHGKLVIGTGRLRILEAIMEVGSMNKAAHKLGQPFRAVWGKIKATEERCGFKLVETTQSGSKLTREGMDLMWKYYQLRSRCERFADNQFRDLFADFDLRDERSSRTRG
ncbi:MAG: LysR family transcriptional regulator [Thermodesulfobacteriota bacterium]